MVDQVCRALKEDLGKSAVVQKRQARNRERDGYGLATSFRMQALQKGSEADIINAGRADWFDAAGDEECLFEVPPSFLDLDGQEWEAVHNPKKLGARTEQAVRSHLHGTTLRPPPIFVGDKAGAESTVAAKLKAWLSSEDGRWWKEQRSALFVSKAAASDDV